MCFISRAVANQGGFALYYPKKISKFLLMGAQEFFLLLDAGYPSYATEQSYPHIYRSGNESSVSLKQ